MFSIEEECDCVVEILGEKADLRRLAWISRCKRALRDMLDKLKTLVRGRLVL